jgi:hypothetical protein
MSNMLTVNIKDLILVSQQMPDPKKYMDDVYARAVYKSPTHIIMQRSSYEHLCLKYARKNSVRMQMVSQGRAKESDFSDSILNRKQVANTKTNDCEGCNRKKRKLVESG